MTAPRDTGWLSRLIVAQVYLVTGGSLYAVTEELTEQRQSIRSTLRGSPFPPIAENGFCRTLGIGSFPPCGDYLGPED